MNKLILKMIAISITAMALLTSCDNEKSLQQFYVDSAEKDGYITTTIPKSIAGIDASKFSDDSRIAYESIDKINLIALPAKDDNKVQVAAEADELDKILQDEKYELLMSHNSDGIKVRMVFDGTQDAIDEIIVYGSSPEMGFGVARILGNDMNVGDLMKMMQELNANDVNPQALKGIMGSMGIPTDKMKVDVE